MRLHPTGVAPWGNLNPPVLLSVVAYSRGLAIPPMGLKAMGNCSEPSLEIMARESSQEMRSSSPLPLESTSRLLLACAPDLSLVPLSVSRHTVVPKFGSATHVPAPVRFPMFGVVGSGES